MKTKIKQYQIRQTPSRFSSSGEEISTLTKSQDRNVQESKPPMWFIDEMVLMAAIAAVSIISIGALIEYVLKPLLHM